MKIVLLGRTEIVLVVIMIVHVVVCRLHVSRLLLERGVWCVDWAATACVHVGAHGRGEEARLCTIGARIGRVRHVGVCWTEQTRSVRVVGLRTVVRGV